MIKHILWQTILVLSVFNSFTFAQTKVNPTESEGNVVAYQNDSRCPSCKGSMGFATQIENWIVRVDTWNNEKYKNIKFILIEYRIYERSLSHLEINQKLRFIIRERKQHEQNLNCIGMVNHKENGESFLVKAELGDYKKTKSENTDDLSDFNNFPCFIVEKLPKVIKSDTNDEPSIMIQK